MVDSSGGPASGFGDGGEEWVEMTLGPGKSKVSNIYNKIIHSRLALFLRSHWGKSEVFYFNCFISSESSGQVKDGVLLIWRTPRRRFKVHFLLPASTLALRSRPLTFTLTFELQCFTMTSSLTNLRSGINGNPVKLPMTNTRRVGINFIP